MEPIAAISEEVSVIIQHSSGVDNKLINSNTIISELEIESVVMLQISSEVNENYGVKVPVNYFFGKHTINDIAYQVFKAKGKSKSDNNGIMEKTLDCNNPFPLNEVQQAFWLGMEDVFPLGSIPPLFFVELEKNSLNIEKLQYAWNELVRRHEMLRAVILLSGQQQILEIVPEYSFDKIDFSMMNHETALQATEAERKSFINLSCEPEKWPLFRISVIKLPEDNYRVFFKIDLLIADLLSCRILIHEWSSLYFGNELVLLQKQGLFRGYILKSIENQRSERYNKAFAYWKERIATLPLPPQLPLEKRPQDLKKPSFKRLSGSVSEAKWKLFKQFSKDKGVSVSMLVCTLFSKIVGSWSSSGSFTLNLMLYQRPAIDDEIYNVVGDFTSNLLLQVDVESAVTLIENAGTLQNQLWQDIDNSEVSGIKVLREMHHFHDNKLLTMPVLFSSNLGLEFYEERISHTGNSIFGRPVFSAMQLPQVWLNHSIIEEKGELIFSWDYIADLFPEGMIEAMFSCYCRLLEQAVTTPEIWGSPFDFSEVSPLKQNLTIPELKEKHARKTLQQAIIKNLSGEGVVLESKDQLITKQELLSSVLAIMELLDNDSEAGRIAIYCESFKLQAAAILATILSGKSVVVIMSGSPAKRINRIISCTDAELLITDIKLNAIKSPQIFISDIEPLVTKDAEQLVLSTESDQEIFVYCGALFNEDPEIISIFQRTLEDNFTFLGECCDIESKQQLISFSKNGSDVFVYDLLFGIYFDRAIMHNPSVSDAHNSLIKCDDIYTNNLKLVHSKGNELIIGDKISLSSERIENRLSLVEYAVVTNIIGTPIITSYEKRSGSAKDRIFNEQIKAITLNNDMKPTPPIAVGNVYYKGENLPHYQNRNHGEIAEGMLFPTNRVGRISHSGEITYVVEENDIIQINGIRTNIAEIRELLVEHPAIGDAVTIYNSDENGRNELVAYVSPIMDLSRVPVSIPCTVENDFGEKYRTVTVNISGNSISIKSDLLTWSMNQQVWVRIDLKGVNKNKKLPGYIKWYSSEIANISLDISKEDFANIQKALNNLFLSSKDSAVGADDAENSLEGIDSRIRAPFYEPCLIKLPRQRDLLEVSAQNISNNGIMISGIKERCIPDQKVKICLVLPEHDETLWVNGFVVWQSKENMGIKFNLDNSDSAIISNSVNTILRTENNKFSLFSISDIKTYLMDYLPEDIVPQKYILLDEIPKNNSGGVQFSALPNPDLGYYPEDESAYEPPKSELEKEIISLFEQVLNIKKAGMNDDFFEWGGDSYKALKFINMLKERIGKEVKLSLIYNAPTAAGLFSELCKKI